MCHTPHTANAHHYSPLPVKVSNRFFANKVDYNDLRYQAQYLQYRVILIFDVAVHS